MAIERVHHVNLRVRPEHIASLRDFYCAVLGLKEGWRPPFSSSGYWLYADSVPVVHLVEMSKAEWSGAGDYGKGTVDHVAFLCSDPQGTAERLKALDIPYRESQVPGTRDVQYLLRDPLGTGVELTFPG